MSSRVQDHLDDQNLGQAYGRLHRKAAIVLCWFVASYVGVLVAGGWAWGALACVSLALATAGVGFNIQHDANHNAFFPTGGSKRLSLPNKVAGLTINVIGGNSKRWIEGHVHQHHAAPNVVGKDHDIDLSPFARMAAAQPRYPWHAFQHVYIWVVYSFTSVSVILGDVVSIVQESISGDRHGKKPTRRDYLAMLSSKGLFLAAMVGVPLLFHPWWVVGLGVIAVLAISGVVLGIVFQLAHVVEEAEFCDADDPTKARWHEWQVRASVDFCHGRGVVDRVFTWYCGGLNYQTEHHLFPGVPHTTYPGISPIVADACREFGIRYHVQPTLRAAVRSHAQHLRRLGEPPTRP